MGEEVSATNRVVKSESMERQTLALLVSAFS